MRIACLLLAAGAGRRFGGCKQLALINGKPLLRHSLETLASVFTENLYVVLGAHREVVRPVVRDLASVIDHENWRQGMGSSIARGIRVIEARESYDGIVVALADQPQLTVDDFNRLVSLFDGNHIVAARYSDQPGAPVIFPPALFGDLQQLVGDRGAKSMLLKMKQDIVTVDLPAAGIDIDTVADAGL
jgi:molybdenum cofactor cytidylyltransferase